MEANLITAMAGVLGSVSGASAAIATTWISQKSQTVRERAKWETRKRETLYGDFITEASRLIADAFDHSLDNLETLVKLYANLGVSGLFRPTPFWPLPKNAAIAFLNCTQNPTGRLWELSEKSRGATKRSPRSQRRFRVIAKLLAMTFTWKRDQSWQGRNWQVSAL